MRFIPYPNRWSGLQKILLGAAITLLGSLPAIWASHLIFFKSPVRNVSDPRFFRMAHPAGFIEQKPNALSLQQFQAELPPELLHAQPSLAKAVALRRWVRKQQPDGASWVAHPLTWSNRVQHDTENPMVILLQQRQGSWAICKRFAHLLAGAAESAGMRARVIVVSSTLYKSAPASHTMAEIWIPELCRWVLMDAMLDLMFTVDQRPASALDVYQAVHARRLSHIETVHDQIPGRVRNTAVQEEFRHLYVAMSNATFDGYRVCFACEQSIPFAHLSSEFSPDYPAGWKKTALAVSSLTTLAGGALWFLALCPLLRRLWDSLIPKAKALIRGRRECACC